MLDRAKLIHDVFIEKIKTKRLPAALSTMSLAQAGLGKQDAIDLFHSQCQSRQLDLLARTLKEKNQAYYTIGSSGHEGNSALAKAFLYTDPAFLHYRSGAFIFQRAKALPDLDIQEAQILSLIAAKSDPISGGRHKVIGSLPLCIPPQTSTIASHLPKSLGAALSITRAKELNIETKFKADSVILCSFGDASLNHASAQSAINAASWIGHGHYPLPLVFICEDNQLGISVPTPVDWVESSIRNRPHLHYLQADGLNIADVYAKSRKAEHIARVKKQAVFLHIKTVRLMGHAGSDIESQYHSQAQIEAAEANDPLLHTARILIEENCLTQTEILEIYHKIGSDLETLAKKLVKRTKLNTAKAVMESIVPPAKQRKSPQLIKTKLNSTPKTKLPRNLSQHINQALSELMAQYNNIVLFGEDVGQKGGVYRVTANLQQQFGQRRVFDTLLDEQTILGTAIGMAHNGFLPIPEIQFLAYLHNAEDQLRGEAATLSFFSNGQYTNPMVIRIAGLAYQKGFGGHFHNDNSIAVLRDIPGIIIACPSNGPDAAKMLRKAVELAYEDQRIVVFLEPIALYMTKDLHETGDNLWLNEFTDNQDSLNLDELGIYGNSKEVCIITYGNGYYLSRQAAKIFTDNTKKEIKIIDLRWLAPLNRHAIIKAVKDCQNILIVDEGRRTGSISEALMALLMENLPSLPNIARLTGEDSFIPIGTAWQHVLPSKETILDALYNLTDIEK